MGFLISLWMIIIMSKEHYILLIVLMINLILMELLIFYIIILVLHMLHIILIVVFLIIKHKLLLKRLRRTFLNCICMILLQYHRPYGESVKVVLLFKRKEINGFGIMKDLKINFNLHNFITIK